MLNLRDQLEHLLRGGKRIEAMKLFRDLTGQSLADTKVAVDHFDTWGVWPDASVFRESEAVQEPPRRNEVEEQPSAADLDRLIDDLVARGDRIGAIKAVRDRFGVGLLEAKQAVERVMRGEAEGRARPEPRRKPATRRRPAPQPEPAPKRKPAARPKPEPQPSPRPDPGPEPPPRESGPVAPAREAEAREGEGSRPVASAPAFASPASADDTDGALAALAKHLGRPVQPLDVVVCEYNLSEGYLVLLEDAAHFVRAFARMFFVIQSFPRAAVVGVALLDEERSGLTAALDMGAVRERLGRLTPVGASRLVSYFGGQREES